MKKLITVLIVITLLTIFSNVALATDGTITSSGEYDIGDYGNDSTITINSDLTVTLTNNENESYSNMNIVCGSNVSLTLNNVKVNNYPSEGALSFGGGNNHLILTGSSELSSAGVCISAEGSLNIEGPGFARVVGSIQGQTIEISGGEIAAVTIDGGTVNISDGIITARISGDIVNITGGTIKASGYDGESAIGNRSTAPDPIIKIEGGHIEAIGSNGNSNLGNSSSGIGSKDSKITISGGIIYAYGGTYHDRVWSSAINDWVIYHWESPGIGSNHGVETSVTFTGDAAIFVRNGVSGRQVNVDQSYYSINPPISEFYGVECNTSWNATGAYIVPKTLQYSANGGQNAPADVITQHINTTTTVRDEGLISKSNALFSHWNTKADGTGDTYTEGDTITLINDVTLYAQWLEKYTVTFDSQGGSAVESQLIESGDKAIKPADPQKQDCTFMGWYKEVECLNAWNFDSDTVNQDTMLFAKWEIILYKDKIVNEKLNRTYYNEDDSIKKVVIYYGSDDSTGIWKINYYKNGVKTSYEEYNESGALAKRVYLYSSGKQKRRELYNTETGVWYSISEYYSSGQLSKKKYLHSNGKLRLCEFYSSSTGNKYAYSEYDTNGKLEKKTYLYSSGVRKKIEYYSTSTGNKYAISEYRTNGKIEKKTYLYSSGVRKKIYYYSSTTGNKYAVSDYRTNGSLEKKTYLYSNGVRKKIYYYSSTTGKKFAISEYRTNGSLAKKTYLHSNGVRKYIHYYSSTTGNKYATSYYDTGGDITKKVYYNSDGSIKETINY